MKLALLSDIHGNSFALQAVLDAVKNNNIDTLIITGDFVGYYFWPEEVMELLKSWKVVAIRGNHDRMLEYAIDDSDYRLKVRKRYGSGLDIAFEHLKKKDIDWLMHLPDTHEFETNNGNILLCHGSPWGDDEYVYPDLDDESLSRYTTLDVKWVIQGHTHYPMYKKNGDVTVINPGSVGQPRDKQIGAQWAQLDTDSNKVNFFCEQYDIKRVVQESKTRHPEIPYLANILQRV
jgi:putative phosphoesterase